MANENSPPPAQPDPDEAPDLSTPEWRPRFAKAPLKPAQQDGTDLAPSSDSARPVSFPEEPPAIKTEENYQSALLAISCHFEREPEPGTPEAEAFDRLADQIRAYEDRHWTIPED
jgi:hypothetical protein